MTYNRMEAKRIKGEHCFICGDKKTSLVKTECCHRWVCCDTSYVSIRGGGYCQFEHENYSICYFHYSNKHKGKWQDCKECQKSFDKYDYERELNFKPK